MLDVAVGKAPASLARLGHELVGWEGVLEVAFVRVIEHKPRFLPVSEHCELKAWFALALSQQCAVLKRTEGVPKRDALGARHGQCMCKERPKEEQNQKPVNAHERDFRTASSIKKIKS
jgi:hypothetical protein